jgi:hypothetical protein
MVGRHERFGLHGHRMSSAHARTLLLAALCVAALFAALAGPAAARSTYKLVYLDGHMHTSASDGSGTADDIKAAALARGLSAVIVTDHSGMLTFSEWQALAERARRLSDGTFVMLVGFEITGGEGLFNRDHVLAWGVNDPFVGDNANELAPEEVWPSPFNPLGTGAAYPENVAAWVRYIHDLGGIAVHAHPSGSTSPAYGVDAIEVSSLDYVKSVATKAVTWGLPPSQAWALSMTLNNMALYGERDLSTVVALPGYPPMTLRQAIYAVTAATTGVGCVLGAPEAPLHSWDELLMAYVYGEVDHPTFGVADSDAHNTANVLLDPAADYSDVGEYRNGVFVRRLTRGALMAAVKSGRCFATTGPALRFTVNGKMMGRTATVEQGAATTLRFTAQAGSPTAVVAQVTVVRNGEVWRVLSPMAPSFSTTLGDSVGEDGYYRIEVVSADMMSGEYQFAYSNPVFVDVEP